MSRPPLLERHIEKSSYGSISNCTQDDGNRAEGRHKSAVCGREHRAENTVDRKARTHSTREYGQATDTSHHSSNRNRKRPVSVGCVAAQSNCRVEKIRAIQADNGPRNALTRTVSSGRATYLTNYVQCNWRLGVGKWFRGNKEEERNEEKSRVAILSHFNFFFLLFMEKPSIYT
ncbi:chaperone DnaJ-domain superfamily protein [Striga asiatica]|uniref:Chaperone DnaJ-domain superfamily protein n=1 Tax=Striga asiatica TaxID=4170 RepID=A0A5A7R4Y8_STRAF|nr:chaperone DnaJ-domain superfamily protein [Striga asiatica]